MVNAYSNNYHSLYRGVVEDNIDPEGLGRCKVRVPSIHGELSYRIEILPWARPLVLSPVKEKRGHVMIPDIGDVVWVLFEGSNRQFPIYFGGTYALGDLEVTNSIVDFYIENDDRISYNRDSRTYDIQIGERHIIITPQSIFIDGNVTIKGNLHVTGTTVSDVDVESDTISLREHVHGGVAAGKGNTEEPVE